VETPPLSGRRVRLREVQQSDYEYLYALMSHPDVAWRWRYRGQALSFESFLHRVEPGTLVHFIVERIATGEPLGYMQAFDASLQWGWCHIAVVLDPAVALGGWAIEAPLLFLNYLFEMYDLRKLYASVHEFNYEQFASFAGDRYHVEARLADHEWHAGRWWDMLILAMYRRDWERTGPKLVAKLAKPKAVVA
jgi:RimJ/RimL family protein N-acetyltransferase